MYKYSNGTKVVMKEDYSKLEGRESYTHPTIEHFSSRASDSDKDKKKKVWMWVGIAALAVLVLVMMYLAYKQYKGSRMGCGGGSGDMMSTPQRFGFRFY